MDKEFIVRLVMSFVTKRLCPYQINFNSKESHTIEETSF
jgi:hypothetical protein